MNFSDIQTRFNQLARTNSTATPAAVLNTYITPATDYVVSLINSSDKRWQWDDSNQSDLPIATGNLVSGQQDYSLPANYLSVDRIEVKDTSGFWTLLKPIDQQLLKRDRAIAMTEYQPNNGTPLEYDISQMSIFFYPIPNYSQSASFKVYFTRGQLNFDYTTGKFTDGTGSTSSSPGIASMFQPMIPLKAAYDYCLINLPTLAPGYLGELMRQEQRLFEYYGTRDRDVRPRFSISTDSNK